MKVLAEKWAEDYMHSEEFKEKYLEMMLYGTTTITENLDVAAIVERYKEFLTENDIENLKKLQNGNNLDV
jgi:hypothetical protein